MSVELAEEQVAICEMAESVARNRLASFVEKWDAEKTMPMEMLRVAAALGFRGVAVRETVGASGWAIWAHRWPPIQGPGSVAGRGAARTKIAGQILSSSAFSVTRPSMKRFFGSVSDRMRALLMSRRP